MKTNVIRFWSHVPRQAETERERETPVLNAAKHLQRASAIKARERGNISGSLWLPRLLLPLLTVLPLLSSVLLYLRIFLICSSTAQWQRAATCAWLLPGDGDGDGVAREQRGQSCLQMMLSMSTTGVCRVNLVSAGCPAGRWPAVQL